MSAPETPSSRILVVDDQTSNLQMVGALLRAQGYSVVPVIDGETALSRAFARPPDLVLLDVNMPGLSGFEVCQQLKASPLTRDVPVIFLTASAEAEKVVEGLDHGAVDYVQKPFNPRELLARVRTHLELKHNRATLLQMMQERTELKLLHELETAKRDSELNRLRHVELAAANRALTDSIQYALRIQQAILPPPSRLQRDFGNVFVLFRPKDIVSGDFFWFQSFGEGEAREALVAVIDCTGHGVPGAVLSVLGYSLLSQIVLEKQLRDPAQILEAVDVRLQDLLHRASAETPAEDGMDVALCHIAFATRTLTFAGARRPIYLLPPNPGAEPQKLQGDRRSLGERADPTERPFTAQTMALEPGTRLFLFTDGVTDLCGRDGRPFGSARLRDFLAQNREMPLVEQGQRLEAELLSFQSDAEGRDDLTLIAFEVP